MTLRRPHVALAVLLAVAAVVAAGCGSMRGPVGNPKAPEPAKPVELTRYLGRWYELARYENGFERGCEAVTADYALRPDGVISVVNTCRKGRIDGRVKVAKGRAKVVSGSQGAKLKVSFFGPFFGDYWVLDRADDYSWSIVGEPSGRFLWVLSRSPKPDSVTRGRIDRRVQELGYDPALVRQTAH